MRLRKQAGEDFDLLVLIDVSRFTRAGIKHGMKVEYELQVEVIEVVFATQPLPAGEDGDLIRPGYYFAAQMYSKSMTYSIVRGMQAALESETMAHCTVAPYGMDFLYSTDGKPTHITRSLPDGRQLKLHPDAMGKTPTKEQILHTFPKNTETKNLHYRKQSYEKVILVPGAPEVLATVIDIFMLSLKGGWGATRIAAELNERGIPAPRGGLWYDNSVSHILHNKTYLGVGIANKQTRAVYAARNPAAPKTRNVSARTLAKRKKPPVEIRPRQDWKERKYPALAGLLGDDLSALAERSIERSLAKKAGGYIPPEVPRHRHVDSDYPLTGILTSKQGNHRLGGYTVHAKNKRYRKYRITKFCHAPVRNPILERRISVEPLEQAKATVKQLVRLLVSKMIIDMETLEFEIEMALPSWAIMQAEGIESALRLDRNPQMKTSGETQPAESLFLLGKFACKANGQPICFECTRLRKAA